MDYRARFEAAAREALAKYEDYRGKDDPTDAFILAITEAASDWASEYGSERYLDGCHDQSEAMSW